MDEVRVHATLDISAVPYTIAGGATLSLMRQTSGELTASDDTTGSCSKFLLGGGAVSLLGQSAGAVWAATSTRSSLQVGVFYSGGFCQIKNGFAGSRVFYFKLDRMLPSA